MSTDRGPRDSIDYSLYLVTGRELLPPGADYYEHLEQTLAARRVTVVQVREKYADNGEMLDIARKTLAICDKYSVPMLVNDNISVALCLPERVGLHIGQDDVPIAEARKLLGPRRIIGLSVHSVAQAKEALEQRIADYVGVGPVYGTMSKAGVTEDKVLGPRAVADVLDALSTPEARLPSVLIGGINTHTTARALAGATGQHNYPDGVAVISAIVARTDPDVASQELKELVTNYQSRLQSSLSTAAASPSAFAQKGVPALTKSAANILNHHRLSPYGPPLIQTLTSHVSSTMSANIALAFSSSPIMSHQEAEAEDLGRVTGAIVLNIGTIGEEARRGMKAVGREANKTGKPVVLDPVGVGASAFRKGCVQRILDETQVTLIKGNAAELSAIAGLSEVASRGVDSGAGTLKDPVGLVKTLAKREKCLVLLTGKTDYLTDGQLVVSCDNGHPLVGKITGSGCALGVMLAAGMAAACNFAKEQEQSTSGYTDSSVSRSAMLVRAPHHDIFVGALVGLLSMTIASEKAAERDDVRGPGSFIPALIDEIAALTPQDLVERAKIDIVCT
ncbi:unnamed protein product [Parajaminaea phylloscopi]